MVAGAVLHAPLAAQVRDTIPKKPDSATLAVPLPPRADSLIKDSLAKIAARDSARRAFERGDTLRTPIVRAQQPIELAIGHTYHWNRDSLFATGALTLADLLERVVGMSTIHAGWVAAPAVGSYLGDVRRVRLFLDGFEYQPLDPRGRGALDLTQFNLWSAEEATIEQAPEEVRIYVRSWRVASTVPETRTDVSTGDQQTNMYRGFYGRRFGNGLALQFGASQLGTNPPTALGTGSDQTGIIARVGWARGLWSVDGFASRINRHRGTIFTDEITRGATVPTDSIPTVASNRTDAYFRVGFADPDTSRLWVQAMAVASKYDYNGIRTLPLKSPATTAADTAFNTIPLDTSTARSQYLVSVGTVRGPLRLSATERLFGGAGKSFSSPAVRGSFATSRLSLSAFLEGKSYDSVSRADVTAQFYPLSFVSLLGSVGRTSDGRVKDSTFTSNYVRAEAGLRVRQLWLVGGVIRRDSVRLPAPNVFDTTFVAVGEGAANGVTAGIRGKLWRILNADVSAIRWADTTGFYRPRYQTRSELFLRTSLLDKFPSGDFGILASLVHEYRSGMNFPAVGGVETVPGYRTFSTLLEIRILTATVSWQFRNFLGERYNQVPGYLMPRQTNFYGVRWSFSG